MLLPNKKIIEKAPKLESKRLLLRPFTLRDARKVSTMGWSNKGTLIKTTEEAKQYIKRITKDDANGYYLGVFLKETGVLIGDLEFCHLGWFAFYGGELCYGFTEPNWGKGYATEASRCLVDYLFRKVKVHKISADTDPDNFASQKVLYKLHFKLEGVAKEQHLDKKKKVWKDEYNWGLIRDEWLSKEKKPLFKVFSK